ncbi:MAG: extracellular solute-binding protein [Clostridia bacterium]|nr:extracellular solute-binding protein [Clostridia bacterium]
MKKLLSLALCLMLALPCVAVADASIVTASGFPVVTEPIKLTVMASQSAVQPDFSEMYIIPRYDEMTGITVEWQCVSSKVRSEKVSNAISSDDLPDIFFKCNISAANLQKYGKAGSIIDLAPYLEEYAPNFLAYAQQNPDVLAAVSTPDGQIFSLPMVADAPATRMAKKLYYNTEWMEKLGLSEPETLDELYDLLYAMRYGDPNGNGEVDEVPMSETTSTLFQIFGGLFGAQNRGTHSTEYDIDPETGKVRHIKTSDAFRECLEFMNKCYKDGLIDQECITANDEHIKGLAAQDRLGIYFATNLALLAADDAAKFVPATRWVDGAIWTVMRSHLHSVGAFVVTKKCENIEAALRWVDYFYTPEGVIFYHFGDKDITYVENEDGSLSYAAKYLDQITGDVSYDEVASQVSPCMGGNNPSIMAYPGYSGMEVTPIPMASAAALLPYTSDVIWPIFTYTDEELAVVNKEGSDLNSYTKQTCTEFLTGERELTDEEWNAYVAQCDEIGRGKMLETMESVIDRVETVIGAR